MKKPHNARPIKRGPSGRETKARIARHRKADLLLASKPSIIRYSSAGVSVDATLTAETLQWAKAVDHEREEITKRAYACIDDEVRRLIWKEKPQDDEHLKALTDALDDKLSPLYEAFKILALDFLLKPVMLFLISQWVLAAKNGNKQVKHVMEKVFAAILWVGPDGRPETVPAERKRDSKNEAAARSKALTRWVKKFEAYHATFGDPQQAYRQTLTEFNESPRIKDVKLKALIRQKLVSKLRPRIAGEG